MKITVNNKNIGNIELEIIKYGHGRWSYMIRKINGEEVADQANAEPMPKREAEKAAKDFGRNCRIDKEYGFVI